MMKRRFGKCFWAGLLALCIFCMAPANAIARTVEEIEQEQAQLDEEKQQLEDKLQKLRDDEAQKQAYQETLQQKIDVLQTQINTARQDISDLNAHITELTLKLEKSEEKIQSTIDQFKQRLVALYKAGDVSTLQILLDSSSFSDFTMRSEMMRSMTKHDQELMNKIEEYMESTKAEREDCEASKKKVADLQKKLESQQKELDVLYQENAAAIAALQDAQATTEDAIAENEKQGAAKIAEMEELIAKQKAAEEEARRQQQASGGEWMGDNVVYPSGGGGVEGFNPIWPLPGVTYVSCYYGGYAGHRGMDIAGAWGTPVVAAESGTVIAANDYDSWGDSWGYYVLIYHNGTFTTRYAHLSSLAVVNGQQVSQGDVVGYEGATGNVTGPHLHFEVYENGSRVDPMIYL